MKSARNCYYYYRRWNSFSRLVIWLCVFCYCLLGGGGHHHHHGAVHVVNGLSLLLAGNLRRRMPGIWKLSIQQDPSLPIVRGEKTIVESLKKNNTHDNNDNEKQQRKEVLLKLHDDGSFRQCDDEGYQEGKWISGRWKLNDEESSSYYCNSTNGTTTTTTTLLWLAMNRQYFGPAHDTLLTGTFLTTQPEEEEEEVVLERETTTTITEDKDDNINVTKPKEEEEKPTFDTTSSRNDSFLCVRGSVAMGKFMYPKKHPSFFEEPILTSMETTGNFSLKQVLSFFKLLPPKDNDKYTLQDDNYGDDDAAQQNQVFQQSDFYNRKFYLTFVPVKCIALERKWDKVQRRYVTTSGEEDQPVDIRAMGMEFFANNTFTIKATNKLLRGRFEVEQPNRLWFQVSLFGAGRSIKGSVYSEGPGISHEDKRMYSGKIIQTQDNTNNHKKLVVRGRVTFGSDVKPPEVGTFLLREVNDTSLLLDMDDEDDDSMFDSVFE